MTSKRQSTPQPPNQQPRRTSPLDRYAAGPPVTPGYNPAVLKEWTLRAADEASKHGPYWFYLGVDGGGPYDARAKTEALENFGNYNYGYMGRRANFGLGFPLGILLRQAGVNQRQQAKNVKEPGSPGLLGILGGRSPYGDDMRDQEMIRRGYYDAIRDERVKAQRPPMLNEQ